MRIRKGFFSKHWTIINLIGRRIRIGPCMNGRTDAREQSFPSDTARLPFMRNGLGGFFKKFAHAYREGFRPSHDRLCKMHNDNGISFSFRNAVVWCASSETSLDLGFNTMRSRFTILLDPRDNCFRSQHRKCWITQILLPWMPLIKGGGERRIRRSIDQNYFTMFQFCIPIENGFQTSGFFGSDELACKQRRVNSESYIF